MEKQKQGYSPHAIQLVELRVVELGLKVDLSYPRDAELGSFTIETGRSNYDREKRQIVVMMKIESGSDESSPLKIVAELHGRFEIDESRFNVKYVEDWAEKNAPLILYPYIRENVYSLTAKSGYAEALLPLLEIPTFKIPPPESVELK